MLRYFSTTTKAAARIDLLSLVAARKVPAVLSDGAGFVELVDVLPRLIPEGATGGDHIIADAARVSYSSSTIANRADDANNRRLIRHLYRHKHTSPFEMAEVVFRIKAPIFVARQWFRHRTANVNEQSARYSVMKDEFYTPTAIRKQSKTNAQGSAPETLLSDRMLQLKWNRYMEHSGPRAHAMYAALLKEFDVAREQARIGLPVSMYTQFHWKCDLHNLLHFLRLRMAPDAQEEIRDYANIMYAMVKPMFPHTCEAFEDYTLNSVTLSALDIKALQHLIQGGDPDSSSGAAFFTNERERAEFEEKVKRLALDRSAI